MMSVCVDKLITLPFCFMQAFRHVNHFYLSIHIFIYLLFVINGSSKLAIENFTTSLKMTDVLASNVHLKQNDALRSF